MDGRQRRSSTHGPSGTGSRSHSRSHSRPRRPQLGPRKNSAKSFISIEVDSQQELPQAEPVEIPTVQATLDHTLPLEYFKQDLLSVIQQLHVSKWHRLPPHVSGDLVLKRMPGALTNAIYKVDPPPLAVLKTLDLHNHNFPVLLLRVYGANVDSLIDRDYELKILVRLSMQNIGPRLFGCFTNGRIEQFLDNAVTLTKSDIMNKRTSARIARRMRELHDGIKLNKQEHSNGPSSWNNIAKWLPVAKKLLNNPDLGIEQEDIIRTSWELFESQIEIYRQWLYSRYENVNDTLVFCHNDTQYGNLLFTSPKLPNSQNTTSSSQSLTTNFSNLSLENLQTLKPSQQEKKQDRNLVVIDFEYSGPNSPSYDIANHFCEWMHNYNHPTQSYAVTESDFPKMDEQFNLIYSYIIKNNPETDPTIIDKHAKMLYNDIVAWRPTVSIFWALWAIIQNGEKAHEPVIIEQGPNGEQYKIVIDDVGEDIAVEEAEEDAGGEADVDNFEYLKYARDKISVFWGDMVQLGLVTKDQVEKPVKLIPTTFIPDV